MQPGNPDKPAEPPAPAAPATPPPPTSPAHAAEPRAITAGAVVIATVLLLIIVGILTVITLRAVRLGSVQARGGCPQSTGPVGAAGAVPGAKQVTAKLRVGQQVEVDFGRAVRAKSLDLYLDLSGPLANSDLINTRVDTFRRDDDGRLSLERIVPVASVDGRTIHLSLCFGRADNRLGDPGSYAGSVTLDDARLANTVTIPITVTMQYVHGVVLWWLFAAVFFPGTWALWVVHTQRTAGQSAFAPRALGTWLFSVGGIVSVTSGMVAAVAVYIATYVRDPTWGSSALQPVTLFGAMFSAFVTTAGLTQLTRGKPE